MLLATSGSPSFSCGTISAVFHAVGNMLETNDKFIISVKGFETIGRQSFNTFIFTLSLPGDLFEGIFTGVDPDSFVMGSECQRHEISRGVRGHGPPENFEI